MGKTRPVPQSPPPAAASASAPPLSPLDTGDGAAIGVAGVSSSSSVGGQEHQCFDQNFLFRLSSACRTGDYLVLEVTKKCRRSGALVNVEHSSLADRYIMHCV